MNYAIINADRNTLTKDLFETKGGMNYEHKKRKCIYLRPPFD